MFGRYSGFNAEHNKKMDDLKRKMGQQGAKMMFNNLLGGVFGGK